MVRHFNELVLPFGGSYVCANFGENRSRNATVRVLADRQIHRLTEANRFYNLSHSYMLAIGQIKIQLPIPSLIPPLPI